MALASGLGVVLAPLKIIADREEIRRQQYRTVSLSVPSEFSVPSPAAVRLPIYRHPWDLTL